LILPIKKGNYIQVDTVNLRVHSAFFAKTVGITGFIGKFSVYYIVIPTL